MKKIDDHGFHATVVLIVVAALAMVGLIGYKVATSNKTTPSTKTDTTSTAPVATTKSNETSAAQVSWMLTQDGWSTSQTAPACPAQPMMKSPVDLNKVTNILYPGQTRGGNYKPHGGFRFDGLSNDQTVTAPIDGYIVRGSIYIEMGEVQYLFDVMNNCGVMYRFDHLHVVSDKLKKIADTWAAPQENSSQTNTVSPGVYIQQGETLATSIGFPKTRNSSVDWGVYDFRSDNEASKSGTFQQAHSQFKELSWHAVCWFDWLPAADAAKIRSLPAGDQTSGKKSDYCK